MYYYRLNNEQYIMLSDNCSGVKSTIFAFEM